MSIEKVSHVLNNSRAKGSDKLVLIGIANHDGDGGAWPAISTLAKYSNMSERSVQYSIGRLVELGEVVVHYNEGGTIQTSPDHRPNRYEIRVPERGEAHVVPHPNGVKPTTERGEAHCTGGVKPTAPEPSLNRPEPSNSPTPHENDVLEDQFNEWWEGYPRKVKKGAARTAFKAALKKTDLETLIEATAVYARSDRCREVQYIMHPASWLRAEAWDDEAEVKPEPMRPPNPQPGETWEVGYPYDPTRPSPVPSRLAPDGMDDDEAEAWSKEERWRRYGR